jgi:hypothetical protein
MVVYTFAEAERKLHEVLEQARASGEVCIQRADGEEFIVRRAPLSASPLDVPGVATDLSAHEIVTAVCGSRHR